MRSGEPMGRSPKRCLAAGFAWAAVFRGKEGRLASALRVSRALFVRAVRSKGCKRALATMSLILAVAFAESCARFWGADLAEVPSAAYAWVGNMDGMQIQATRVLYFYLILLVASLSFADSFSRDAQVGTFGYILSRCSKERFLAAASLASFVVGALVVFVPLFATQLFALLAFPLQEADNGFSGVLHSPALESHWDLMGEENALFPKLYFDHPYLSNLVFMAYAACWSGLAAQASTIVSALFRPPRLVALGAPTFVYLAMFMLLPPSLSIAYYLYPCVFVEGLSLAFFCLAPFCVAVLHALVLAYWLRSGKDIAL